AGVGTEGVAEIDQHQLAAEVGVVADDAVLINQGERPADRHAEAAAVVGNAAKPPMIDREGPGDQHESGDEDDKAAAGSKGHVESHTGWRRAPRTTPRRALRMARLYCARKPDGNLARRGMIARNWQKVAGAEPGHPYRIAIASARRSWRGCARGCVAPASSVLWPRSGECAHASPDTCGRLPRACARRP